MPKISDSLTRAMPVAGAYDGTALTIGAIIATDAPVPRADSRGPYLEVLDPAGLDLSALSDLPLLDGHDARRAGSTIGRAFGFARDGGSITATVRFSTAADVEPIRHRVADGTLRHFSIGYAVQRWTESILDGKRTRRAVNWTLSEVSIVSIPADPNAKRIRSMPDDTQVLTRDELVLQVRTALGLPDTFGDDLPADATPDAIRAAALAALQTRQAPRVRITRDHGDPATITRRKADAMAFRMAGCELPDDSREFASLSFKDIAAEALTRAGESIRGLSAADILTRAAHTTSDFSLVVATAVNKVALSAYQAAESPLKQLARQRTLPNFKESTSIRLGELGKLAELSETGEITATSRAESGEVMRLATFARRLDISRKLMIDDDLNLLGDMTAALGQAAAQTEADIMVALITGNPALRDGTTVFHASRGNISVPADLSVASLGLARKAMRERRGLDGVTPISATPKYLLVGPELETVAEQVLSALYAASVADVNPFAGKLTLLVEPRLAGNDWYVFADPARLAGMQYAYLSAAQGVQIQRQEAWNTLGLSFRAFLDFGAGWVDHRGAQYNAGA